MAKRTITERGKLYFATLTVTGWVDVFTRRVYKDILVDNLAYCQAQKSLRVFAWCIMSNHVHLVAACDAAPLTYVLGKFKSYTAKVIMREIDRNPQESRKEWLQRTFEYFSFRNEQHSKRTLWRAGNYPVLLETRAEIEDRVNYIHDNPVRAGIVGWQEDYLYSSAGPIGLLKLDVI